jgi:hypothetical protein
MPELQKNNQGLKLFADRLALTTLAEPQPYKEPDNFPGGSRIKKYKFMRKEPEPEAPLHWLIK